MSTQTELPTFAGKSLELVSPFEVISEKQEDRMTRDNRPYKIWVLTCVPAQNRSVKFVTPVFKGGHDQIRAIHFLNPKSLIQATQNGKSTTFSGVLPPPS